jgi:ABC-2 type transport system permease protein
VGLALALGAIDLPESTGATIALVLVYFVLGYAFYACAFAAAGAIVSRQEDAQSTTTPLLLVLVAAYVLSLGVIDDPDGTVARIGTYVPPMAPMVVPARAARDALPAGELAASIALMLAGSAAVLWLGARIYERTVLRYGAPLKLTQALRLAGRRG